MGLADRAATEDHVQQADVTRRLLYYLNAPLAAHCRLRGVLPTPGAVRIAMGRSSTNGRPRTTRTAICWST
ncbi:hypothetical protein ACFWJM_14545 [Streptomyces sp. NPDC127077]|uniref:hypothetical protein n=1 Tax=Streptomyces sp. NPDC127077 TaxID=3347131 RepID=UPI00364FD07D